MHSFHRASRQLFPSAETPARTQGQPSRVVASLTCFLRPPQQAYAAAPAILQHTADSSVCPWGRVSPHRNSRRQKPDPAVVGFHPGFSPLPRSLRLQPSWTGDTSGLAISLCFDKKGLKKKKANKPPKILM